MSHPPKIRRGYADSPWGQLHYRSLGHGPQTPLVCLHATAYSGRTFEPLMPHLAQQRQVLAPDTPGYGDSDPPPGPASVGQYAEALRQSLHTLLPNEPFDLLGYHTGALIATEIAAQAPERVRRIVLIGVPYFERLDKALWRARLVHHHTLGMRLAQFQARWDFLVTERARGLSLERGFANFVDELKAWPRDAWAHQALFDYPATQRLAQVRCPVLIINPTSTLAQASRDAAEVLPNARVTERPELEGAIFDNAPETLAHTMTQFLDHPP